MSTNHDLSLEALVARGVRQIAITWDNHAGESLVKVVPLRHWQHAVDIGVGFSPISDAFRSDGIIDPCASPHPARWRSAPQG